MPTVQPGIDFRKHISDSGGDDELRCVEFLSVTQGDHIAGVIGACATSGGADFCAVLLGFGSAAVETRSKGLMPSLPKMPCAPAAGALRDLARFL